MGKRRNFGAEFKARVSMEAIEGALTMAQLAKKYDVHPNMVALWKKQAVAGMVGIFSGEIVPDEVAREREIHNLHAKIGQLTIERDFLKKVDQRLRALGDGK